MRQTSLETIVEDILETIGYVVKPHSQRFITDAANTVYFQVPVCRGNKKPFVIDFALENARIGIEVDGLRWHSNMAHVRDILRDKEIRSMGWSILRFKEQHIKEHPSLVASQLRRGINLLLDV